ncbi:ADP-ribosylglycohydrolase family protein [Archaeoglobus veneficus]|uniref:ADP-ribosylglycohydrolase family protein n=1 Tax=Archaeoglobus veneficus TaxID=58290 RepID=UPI0012EA7851|nr:ADP-ribosylglycohydrolase family protein [Archaeoglobus veneficus]
MRNELPNSEKMKFLFSEGIIRAKNAPFLYSTPEVTKNIDWDKIKGMLLGVAIGDSLGYPVEGIPPNYKLKRYGEITDYIPTKRSDWKPIGVPTDDTQLTFWTVEVLLENNGYLNVKELADRFVKERIFGIGSTIKGFIRNYKDERKPWYLSGVHSAGNGALMRISPVLIPHVKKPSNELWADTLLSTLLTHNDPLAISSSVAFVNILWKLLQMEDAPPPNWWIDEYVKVASQIEGGTRYKTRRKGLMYSGSGYEFINTYVRKAVENEVDILKFSNKIGSGAYLLETLPFVIYVLCNYSYDPEESIVKAVTYSKDSDTIGAIVGSAVGALHGAEEFPHRWVNNLTGRLSYRDDGRIFKLLDKIKSLFNF